MLSGILTRAWEFDEDFDQIISNGAFLTNSIQWVASEGTPIKVVREMTADEVLQRMVVCVEQGEAIGDVCELFFPRPGSLQSGRVTFSIIVSEDNCGTESFNNEDRGLRVD